MELVLGRTTKTIIIIKIIDEIKGKIRKTCIKKPKIIVISQVNNIIITIIVKSIIQ